MPTEGAGRVVAVPFRRESLTIDSQAPLHGLAPFDPVAPTIFHQPWWLDAATDGRYREAVVLADGRIVGRFPFVQRRLWGQRTICDMPELTHFLGPAIDEGPGADCNRTLRRADIMRRLLDQIPPTSGFYQKMHAGIPDMLVFQERCYGVSVEFTFELQPAPEATLWRNMRDKTRNVIRRAQERMTPSDETDPAEFIATYNQNLRRRGLRNVYADATMHRLCAAAIQRDAGRILAIKDADGTIAAAIFCIWDARTTYYLLSTRRPDAGNGAISLLIWRAIRHSAARQLVFDFDGIGTYGSVLFFAGFGGHPRPIYVAHRYSPRHRATGFLLRRLGLEKDWANAGIANR